ncbi:Stk1 family PASTA domain-containing Ser/Thr kinase [Pelotomaculum sp. FP]|uniref:Stk1 family PASTA domain-containing Ser/Thr kinase n=1 Tax=Pelotomaculum sp. FP TaxID=261474 RepID=UPI001FAAFF9E|nr:Stk1 family PASTA domain-containing Ser/Thr kinase [Pelotomaculum sp. FP]
MNRLIGKLLGNRYEILEQLGGGGMAIIYKGRDTLLNRLVSIKVLRPEFTCDEDFIQRFRREAQAIASLSHPNIVSIYDVGWEDKVHYLVIEYIEGDNLKNLIRAQGTIQTERAVEIARQISDALQHAHENNIVHRDVKPQNILITREGRAKLTDFGIAKEATTATLTQTDTIVGSVHYISPEQARGETAGPRSDIYSLGIVLYEMVTGALPFEGETPIGVALKHIREAPPHPSSLNPAVSPMLESIIARAMAKNSVERYETARQLSLDLDKVAKPVFQKAVKADTDDEFATRVIPTITRGNLSPPPAAPAPEQNNPGRRRTAWLWAALVALGLLAAGVAAFQLYINVPEIPMPAVEGMTQEEAKSELLAKGIKEKNIQITLSAHPTVQAGRVISQDPPAQTSVKVTRTVTLTVSQGPEVRTVPDVVGYSVSDARIKISQNELNVAEPQQERYSDEYPEGVVMDQDPEPNTKLSRGSGVTLYVSKGPQPADIQVPDLAGKTVEQARSALDKVKLKLDDNFTKASSAAYMEGQIISQSPDKGTAVVEGSTVQVTVSNGPGPSPRTYRVEFRVKDDDKTHEVKIVVNDVRGSSTVYVNTEQPGKKVVKDIQCYGKAVVQVYIDNELFSEKTIE